MRKLTIFLLVFIVGCKDKPKEPTRDGKILWRKELMPGKYAIGLNALPKGIYVLAADEFSEKVVIQKYGFTKRFQ